MGATAEMVAGKAILVHVFGEDAAATSKLLKPALIAQLTDKLTGFDVSALPAPVAETPAPSAAAAADEAVGAMDVE